jgi:hypothetical protein
MSISGGLNSKGDQTTLTFAIKGGKTCTKVYNDTVSTAIHRFVIISSTLSKMITTKPNDINFYISQLIELFKYSHIECLPGTAEYQIHYNAWLIDGYIRMILESNDLSIIVELLDLNSILRTIEIASKYDIDIEYDVAPIKVKKCKQAIQKSTDDTLKSYLQSINKNIKLLEDYILDNKSSLDDAYKAILKVAKKHLV